MTFFVVRVADRPADATHHYGHGKVENLSALRGATGVTKRLPTVACFSQYVLHTAQIARKMPANFFAPIACVDIHVLLKLGMCHHSPPQKPLNM